MENLAVGFVFGLGIWLSFALVALAIGLLIVLVLFLSYLTSASKKPDDKETKKQPDIQQEFPDGVYYTTMLEDRER